MRSNGESRFKKILVSIRNAWLVVCITASVFLAIEVVLSIAYYYRDGRRKAAAEDPCFQADAYQNVAWARAYYRDYAKCESQWASYVYWRRRPFQSQYINVNADGIRNTWFPDDPISSSGVYPKIFFFGGSTTWGTGARDDFTIPSLVGKRLSANGAPAHITNFGELGYVTTQEVIRLIRELQKGNIPDLVVFYDGVNDMFAAYQQGHAGIPQNESNRVKDWRLSLRLTSGKGTVFPYLVHNLSTTRFLRGICRRLGMSGYSGLLVHDDVRKITARPDADCADLAKDVLTIYKANIDIIESLARHYSFKSLFYWQPTIFSKTHLTPYEQKEKDKGGELEPLIALTCDMLAQQDLTQNGQISFRNASALFADVSEPVFLDWNHIGEAGNDRVAEIIAADILAEVRSSSVINR